jgi:hypothetical protein
MFDNHTISPRKVFGTIAADDTRIVININHAVGDSRFLVGLCEHICDPVSYGKTNVPELPDSCYGFFWKRIKMAVPQTRCSTNPTLTRLFPKFEVGEKEAHRFVTYYVREPIHAFKCYDHKSGKAYCMTEAMWMALALSTVAYNGVFTGSFGLSTLVDLRRFLTSEQLATGGKQNWVSTIPVIGRARPDQTVGEVAKEMRDCPPKNDHPVI